MSLLQRTVMMCRKSFPLLLQSKSLYCPQETVFKKSDIPSVKLCPSVNQIQSRYLSEVKKSGSYELLLCKDIKFTEHRKGVTFNTKPRIDDFLAKVVGTSRTHIEKSILCRKVFVNGKSIEKKKSKQINAGDIIEIELTESHTGSDEFGLFRVRKATGIDERNVLINKHRKKNQKEVKEDNLVTYVVDIYQNFPYQHGEQDD